MLRSVHLENIKSLRDVAIDLSPLTVLVGPNGCGKSTVLDQIEAICAFTTVQPSSHVLGHFGDVLKAMEPEQLRATGSTGPMRWRASHVSGRSLSLEIAADGREPWWDRALLSVHDHGEHGSWSAKDKGDERAVFTELLARAFGWRAQRLRLVPSAIAAPSSVDLVHLEADGSGLPTILKDLAANDPRAYASVQSDLRTVVPQFEELRFGKTKSAGRSSETALQLVMRGAGAVPAGRVSDGTLLALALLTATHNRDLPDIVLMDDIDHGLHLAAQLKMLEAIRSVMRVRPELQVICSTHSPYLLHQVAVEEVRVMTVDAQGHAHLKPLSDHPEIGRWRTAMTAGELWANLGEEWILAAH